VTLLFAIVIVFLALSAQYESFRDPVVILVSVPIALLGALIFIKPAVYMLLGAEHHRSAAGDVAPTPAEA
jgi:Cu/Ag efflux pump CusA